MVDKVKIRTFMA